MQRKLKTHTVHHGKLIDLRVDTVEKAGQETIREIVTHPGAVAILPVTTEGTLLLVEQHRYPVDRTLLEIPAGTREPGESAVETARREVEEETGYAISSIVEICRFFSSPGWSTEEIVLFKAILGKRSGHGFDHKEILNVMEIEPGEIPALLRDGLITDAKTIIALCLHSGYSM